MRFIVVIINPNRRPLAQIFAPKSTTIFHNRAYLWHSAQTQPEPRWILRKYISADGYSALANGSTK